MSKEITNSLLLQTMNEQFEKIDKQFETINERFEQIDERFDDLTFITKLSFDELGQRVEQNTQSIAQLKETVGQTNDHLCRVELTMTQEFAASNLQRRRITTQLHRHNKRINTLEAGISS